jgi:hypothetical protein
LYGDFDYHVPCALLNSGEQRNMIDAQERSAKEQRELLASVAPAESSTATLSAPKQQKPAAKQGQLHVYNLQLITCVHWDSR